jgi:hypothetical protein
MRKNNIVLNILFLILNINLVEAVTLKTGSIEVDQALVNQEQAVTPADQPGCRETKALL